MTSLTHETGTLYDDTFGFDVDFKEKESLRAAILEQIGYIPDEAVVARKSTELTQASIGDITSEGLPQFEPYETLAGTSERSLMSQGIEPQRYLVWLNAMLPSDRHLAKTLVKHIQYIPKDTLRKKMQGRLQEGLSLAQGENVLWVAISRYHSPHGGQIGKDRYPSGYRIMGWYAADLLQNGYSEVGNPHRESPVRYFIKHTQRIALLAGARLVESPDLLRFLHPEFEGADRLDLNGVAILGEDWTLGGSHKANIREELGPIAKSIISSLRLCRKIMIGHGYTTKQAHTNIDVAIGESFSGYPVGELASKEIIKPYLSEPTVPAVSEVPALSDPQTRDELIYLSPYKYLDINMDHLRDGASRKVLAHSGISVPDNTPDVLRLGPWSGIHPYALLPHPGK